MGDKTDETTKTETQATTQTQAKTETEKSDPTAAELAELRAYRAQVEAERAKAEEERAKKAGEFESLAKQAADRAAQAEARAERAERGATLARLGVTDDVVSDYAIHAYERMPADKRPPFEKWAKEQQKEGGVLAKLAAPADPASKGFRATSGAKEAPSIPKDAPRRLVEQFTEQWRHLERQGMTQSKDRDQWIAERVSNLHKTGK